ncbi:beta-galactosidase GalA [Sphingomonas desiccabilis]|uniref:Glycoside hydrolase family 2 protein n=1 Tax=Sphingomonas desiccabilis TaxID=429134 RepID=A0A4Q2J1V9_9SPHN|nr:beta-galactosidase GalA [Sphingomonas desiccabilis]MBB3910740.1 beta-galactosidase [Sphingomonas desiccabilis]RXZ35352.1 glycoside hydrolase family 2 protein [Sphingomonas desiccabilis]
MHRRQLLAGGAGLGALIATNPQRALAAPAKRLGHDGFPMPQPARTLPQPLLVQDPSRTLLERGWRFHEGDVVPPMPDTHNATYLSVKAGNALGAAAVAFDDSDWHEVRLPHDWAAAQPFVETANVSQGYRPRGIAWYRRTLQLDPADRGKTIELHFDGIATNATVWVNGSTVAHNWSGYNSVHIDLTPFARFGDEANVIAIRVDANAMEGWWYEGAGLYRHAWLVRRAPVAIVTDGVHCDPRRGDDGRWHVPVAATLANTGREPATVTVEALLLDGEGKTAASGCTEAIVPVLQQAEAALKLDAGNPALWSVETPALYTVVTRVLRDGAPVDERRTPIGFRTIRFDADRGFFLNDRPVKLKGVCLHQDHAGVGVAVPDALIAWRLERLKAMGCNAIRCTHNAPNAELLDLCDRMGFLVMDENRHFNPAPDYMDQLEWLVRRDRNHPSVILWSVFNEEPMQGTEAGVEMVRRMAATVHRLDGARPVTAAMNGSFYDPVNVSTVVDVMGFNYYQADYDRFHQLNPTKPITSSEDTSAFETRGAYESIPAGHVITSYDKEAASWGGTHRDTWREIAKRPFVAGGFVWTGFDYHGEPTPYDWPTIASFFGILDLCGFPKTAFDIHRAHWIDDAAVVGIAPHWTWPGREGQTIPVFVSSNAETVLLRLNGRDLGVQKVDRIMGNEWQVPYQPGRIEALAMRGGKVVATAVHETAGAPVALRLTPARTVMAGDGEDVQPITVDAVDARGRHVPTVNRMTQFTVEGAEIIGVGNGDPNSHEPEQGDRRSLFNGLAQLIVRAAPGKGSITLRATADGLAPARLTIRRLATQVPPQVPVTPPTMTIAEWRRSPAMAERPDPSIAPPDGDNNSWAFLRSGTPTRPEPSAGWRVYRAAFRPWKRVGAEGGTIRFDSIGGTAELWLDGRKLATKEAAAPGPLTADIPAGTGPRRIALLVSAPADAPSGILGRVSVTTR